MSTWGIDLGTTNTKIACFNDDTGNPEMVYCAGIARENAENTDLEVRYSIPTCVLLKSRLTLLDKIGKLPFMKKHFFVGSNAYIGKQAFDHNGGASRPNFACNWKPVLGRDPYKTVARCGSVAFSARYVTECFLREILAALKTGSGRRPRHIVVSVPVDSYESYGAEVSAIARRLGIKKVRIIDEPVSAALGYGLSVDNPKIVLVIDFGGSTLDLALVAINEKGVERGQCRVIAKTGLDLGGVVVDSWIVEKFCRSKAYDLGSFRTDRNASFWYSVMLDEAQRVKEGLYTREKETFYSAPPRELQDFYARIFAPDTALDAPLDLSREDLVDLLETNGLYAALSGSLDLLLGTASARSVPDEAIDEVLLVGGSCLLPGVYGAIERRFGRDRVRAWQPFNAVAYGNATFASGRFNKSDFVIHDYAIVTYDRGTGNPVHNVIVPRGTSFPTGRDFWKRQFTPLCAIGEPERIFKLLICEIGERHSVAQEFAWDTRGRLHTLDSENEKKLVVPLNDENPVLGYLHPPHRPDDKSARIEISFMVNENRWLLATVFDLKTRRNLLTDAPVVRLR